MSLTNLQIMALADAEAGRERTGLEKWGNVWAADRPNSRTYADRTIRSLVDRGLLKLWAGGRVAHVTDLGLAALRDWRGARGQ